jgi:hypothetical protein
MVLVFPNGRFVGRNGRRKAAGGPPWRASCPAICSSAGSAVRDVGTRSGAPPADATTSSWDPLTPRTPGYRSQSRLYLLDTFGADTPLHEITTDRIEEWQQELLEEGRLARRTIQKAQVQLHAILKRAKKKGWVERNAAETADRIVLKRSATSMC